MSDKTNNGSTNGGIGFTGALTVLFVGLKLTGHLDWSWWWVLSPLLIAFVVAVVVVAIIAVGLWRASR